MSTWLQDGKSAIQEALVDAFNKIEEGAKAELQERDRRNGELLGELRQLQDHAANVTQLQQDNESLRKQLKELLESHKAPGTTSPNKRLPLGELSPNKLAASRTVPPGSRLGNEAVDYEKEYNKLHAKYDILEKSRDKYKSVLRQRIEQIDKWAEASDKQKAIIERLRKRLAEYQSRGVSEVHADTASIGPLTDDGHLDVGVDEPGKPSPNSSLDCSTIAAPNPSRGLTVSRYANTGAQTGTKDLEDLAEGVFEAITAENGPAAEPLELPKLPERREHSSNVALKVELSSDGPVFVSERPVHKRRRDREHEPRNKQVQRIKSEHSSSGPEYTGEVRVFAPTESFDFEEDIHIPTPKKRKVLGKTQQHARADGALESRATGSFSHETLAPSAATETLPTPTIRPGNIRDPDRAPTSHGAVARTSGLVTPSEQQPHSHTVFQLGLGISDLAEDGDAGVATVQRRVAKGRLDALLNSPSVRTPKPKIQPASYRVKSLGPASEDDHEDALRVPARRELPHGKKLPPKETSTTPMQQKAASAMPNKSNLTRERAPKRPSILRDDMPRGRQTDREKVPLRQRPMDTLRPEDFKPNPSYNDGLTFVYDEVVRGREARSALSGCTDLNCCGKTFRSFAKAERSTIGPSVTTRAEDIKLLEDYLGDDAYKLGSMTRDEKEETWLLAKTWELSSKFGRHRQRYTRMPSPPGFWLVDFPSTQERAEERRQAEEIQKALVNERYREAMRPGGRWLFRDEDGR